MFFSEEVSSSEEEKDDESQKKQNESDCRSDEAENEELELRKQLKTELNELVFYKIEMPSASSNKKIILCIDRIIEIINIISNKSSTVNYSRINYTPNSSTRSNENKEAKKQKFKDFNFYEVNLIIY